MAVSRGGIAFWGALVRDHGRRPPIKNHWILSQVAELQWICQTRPLSSASWALAPPNTLRYQNVRQPVLSHPFICVSQPHRASYKDDDWEECVDVCVLAESEGLHAVLDIPVSTGNKLAQLLPPRAHPCSDFSFPMTTVDGSKEDDISIHSFSSVDASKREHGCFRKLFEAERCPAPFMYGSHFYCFHCPGTEPVPGGVLKSWQNCEPDNKPVEPSPLPHTTVYCYAERAERKQTDGERERDERLAVMYERLRVELPSFFTKRHDYSMYSNDVEFINGLLHTKTRGRVVYQISVSLWRLLCQCYYAQARLEVLKLTKHKEDGTIKARWRIRGLPFYSLLLRFYRKDKSHLYRSYDAFSTFYIGQDGLIYCHKVEKMMPSHPPALPRVTSLLAGALVALGVQEHRPALNLLPLLLSSLRQSGKWP